MTRRSREYTAEEKAKFAADRREKVEQLGDQLAAAVAGIQDSDHFRRYLRTQARFHRYSFRNTLLIMMQCPTATQVAGYQTWQALGRQVRKGETGIRIYAPVQYRVKTEGGDQDTQADAPTRTGFRAVSVFDVSQTDGELLPDISPAALISEDGGELYAALSRIAEGCGLTITHTPSHPTDADGYYNPKTRTIYVRKDAQSQMTATLAHELAHALDEGCTDSPAPERETVAEGVAFLVLAHFGLDCGTFSFAYIAGWNQHQDGRETLTRCMARIQQIARELIDGAAHHLDPEASAQEHALEIAA